jgi:hypothetical protein
MLIIMINNNLRNPKYGLNLIRNSLEPSRRFLEVIRRKSSKVIG